jgi:predicted small metal-binding protein
MAKTVGCSDFNQNCSFRITADSGEEDMMVDVATAHAMKYHEDFALDEATFRSAMVQAHMSAGEIAEMVG